MTRRKKTSGGRLECLADRCRAAATGGHGVLDEPLSGVCIFGFAKPCASIILA
jgi:hypothetical protein